MTDHFAALSEPRRPWLDPQSLKRTFLALSATVHPDRVHPLGEAERAAAQARYVALNAAYTCLRDPKSRLRHLLELERQALPRDIQRTPPELTDLFLAVGQACRASDGLLAEKAKITSPLLKVQWFQRSQAQTDVLAGLQQQLNARREELLETVRRLDAAWNQPACPRAERMEILNRLEQLHHLFGYYDRWLAQVQERTSQLGF